MFFLICQRVWKTVECQEKIREKSGNFEVDDKWQPWYCENLSHFLDLMGHTAELCSIRNVETL